MALLDSIVGLKMPGIVPSTLLSHRDTVQHLSTSCNTKAGHRYSASEKKLKCLLHASIQTPFACGSRRRIAHRQGKSQELSEAAHFAIMTYSPPKY